jgi:hypothetical protein
MDTRFGGGSAGLLQRLRAPRIDVADLRDVAEAVLPRLATARLRVDVVSRAGAGSLVVVEEDERRTRVHLSELADDMSRSGVAPTEEGMAAALATWLAHRPVTDAAAATSGVAVLDWCDSSRTTVGWRVVVRRVDVVVPWTPSRTADVIVTRSGAVDRAQDVSLDLRVEGPVALFSHPDVPLLATSALVAPERMHGAIATAGLAIDDMHVVVTPHRPMACAGAAVAARLAGETTEASVTLPWRRLADLPWT